MSQQTLCAVNDCGRNVEKREWCRKHYARWYRHGSVNTLLQAPKEKVTKKEKMDYVRNYKLSKGCQDCGYNKHHSALDFDHLEGTEKVRDIKSGQQLGWAALLKEIEKCEVVCANCHRIRTYNRRVALNESTNTLV